MNTNSYMCVWILRKKGRRERGARVGERGIEKGKKRKGEKEKRRTKKCLLIYL